LNVVVARPLAVSKVEKEKKLFARVLCWLLRTDAYFGKPFTNMLPSAWQVALGVIRIPNTLGSAAVFGFVLAPSLLRGGHLSAAACCPYSGRSVLAIGEVVACCDVVLGWHFFFFFCFFFFLALTALAYR
jgi:hypothetical protein